MNITIRVGQKNDLPEVFSLVKELAEYEKAPNEVTNTVEKMEEDGFGKNPLFGFFVALENEVIVGIALYYYRYSTWKGKRLYLEDIVVTETHRNKGIGKLLFCEVLKQCEKDNCSGIAWQVLDWNEPAIQFYKKFPVQFDDEWINCSIDINEVRNLL